MVSILRLYQASIKEDKIKGNLIDPKKKPEEKK